MPKHNLNLTGSLLIGSVGRNIIWQVFKYCLDNNPKELNVNISWYDGHILRYSHFEDQESFQEKINYLLSQLNLGDCKLNITHKLQRYRDGNPPIFEKFFKTYKLNAYEVFKYNKVKKNKVCFWRFDVTYNSANRLGKSTRETEAKLFSMFPEDWEDLYHMLNEKYTVVELSYRTPIREVMYHLRECDFCVGYGGMYHTLVNMLSKPMFCILKPKVMLERVEKENHFFDIVVDQKELASIFIKNYDEITSNR